ncbi:N-alpha-acetyltransferase 40-like [Saccostrea cucullata]|uniref:N-alpha-acetyltransferase 40-like n=1 Tax=Saccostrea cuccullata TaxID=36930 RepID=UPI002ED4A5DA
MGRKSTKGKERKKKRKEENAKYDAALVKVEAANKIPDPLELVAPFKKFERNGLKLKIECKKVTDMEKELIDWAFQLTKANMQKMYEESDWGWKDKDKYTEMTEEKAQYLIASDITTGKPVAFTHFRFDMELDEEVVYCYEIQLETECRRKGLGKFLMQILELLAYKTDMTKVMLTTFKNNKVSQDFFKKTMKYEVDEISPEDPLFDDGYHYEILSKSIKPKPKPATSDSVTTTDTQPVTAS